MIDASGPAQVEGNTHYADQMLADESMRQSFEAEVSANAARPG